MNNISLLREKFTIRDLGMDATPIIALGNRLQITIAKKPSPLIVRGHSMHMTLRIAAEILKQLSYIPTIENVETILDWETAWEKLIKNFESENVPDTWIAVYYEGKTIFHMGNRHMFFDVIEQTEFKNFKSSNGYDQSIIMAQNAFKKMGRSVMIEQESHVGFVLDEGKIEMRFAVILRTPVQRATFTARLNKNKDNDLKPYDYICMQLAADFIEGINMAVRSGFLDKDIATGDIEPRSEGMQIYNRLQKQMKYLDNAIGQTERKYKLSYRPEKPDFIAIQKACYES